MDRVGASSSGRKSELDIGLGAAAKALDIHLASIDKATASIVDLIANQPQLYIEVNYREHEEVTGPDELSSKFVYEMGMSGNINDFISWVKGYCGVMTTSYPKYACMAKNLAQKPKASDNGNRLAISVECDDADALEFELLDDEFSFNLDPTQKWVGSLTYGRYFSDFRFLELTPRDGSKFEDGTRCDLEAKYEDVTGDPKRPARFVATATFGQRMGKTTLFSVSAVYANKPECRGEVDEEVSARFGLRWKRSPAGDQ